MMRIATNWLQTYLDQALSVDQMVRALEAAGVEVEDIIDPGKIDSRVVVAEIKDIQPHPDAERLQIATVEAGDGKHQVVCGAPNIQVGQRVPFAQTGATLPSGTTIKKTTIRGQSSDGMLMSPKELNIGQDHSGILILDSRAKVGTPLQDLYGAKNTVVEVDTPANRPDLQSAIGLAREIAAHTDNQLVFPEVREDLVQQLTASGQSELTLFDVQASDAVRRYNLAKITLASAGRQSSETVRRQLLLSNMRPIDTVVDLTNYSMMATGQPLHAFDAEAVSGQIVVRYAKSDEKITTIDQVERVLTPKDLVIADENGPIALAGLIGGQDTQVTSRSREILLETATFDGTTVRRMAVRHGIRTEASARFERDLPLQFVPLGLEHMLHNLEQHKHIEHVDLIEDRSFQKVEKQTVTVQPERIARRMNVDISRADMEHALAPLGFTAHSQSNTASLTVQVPYWRPDVNLEEDIAEEVIKQVGLDKVPVTLPDWRISDVDIDRYWPRHWQLRTLLQGLGLMEATTYPFVSEDDLQQLGLDPDQHLKLQNPRSEEQRYLRSTLLPSLLRAVADNTRVRHSFGFFEIAKAYQSTTDFLPEEPLQLGVITQSASDVYQTVKNTLDQLSGQMHIPAEIVLTNTYPSLHPARQADIYSGQDKIGYIGELHPEVGTSFKIKQPVAYCEINVPLLLQHLQSPVAQPTSRYQSATRDVTVLLDRHITWQQVRHAVAQADQVEITYQDDYYGDELPSDKRALTFTLTVGSTQKTLTDKEVARQVDDVLDLLAKNFDAHVKQ